MIRARPSRCSFVIYSKSGDELSLTDIAAQHHYESSTHEHIVLLQAIRDGKPEEAKNAMSRHISRSMANILEHRA